MIRKLLLVALSVFAMWGAAASHAACSDLVIQRRVSINGVDIFFREAGEASKPALILLHGFPSSSHMFRDILPILARHFHVFAPDYPGMGNSGVPSDGLPPLTFDKLADYIYGFLRSMNVEKAILYMQDFGGPVGMRIAVSNPDLVAGLIIQNTPISLDGWDPGRLKAIQALRPPITPQQRALVEARVALATDLALYKQGASNPDNISPDAWASDAFALANPAKHEAMVDLQMDIPSNLKLYPSWQRYLREAKPKALVVWGDGDPVFMPRGADAVADFDPNTLVHHYKTGHFALEEFHDEIAREIIERFAE